MGKKPHSPSYAAAPHAHAHLSILIPSLIDTSHRDCPGSRGVCQVWREHCHNSISYQGKWLIGNFTLIGSNQLEANSIALPRSRNDSQIHSQQRFWPGAIRLTFRKSCRKSFRDGNLGNLLKGHVQTASELQAKSAAKNASRNPSEFQKSNPIGPKDNDVVAR